STAVDQDTSTPAGLAFAPIDMNSTGVGQARTVAHTNTRPQELVAPAVALMRAMFPTAVLGHPSVMLSMILITWAPGVLLAGHDAAAVEYPIGSGPTISIQYKIPAGAAA